MPVRESKSKHQSMLKHRTTADIDAEMRLMDTIMKNDISALQNQKDENAISEKE